MKVFVSWSGSQSKSVALALRDWLPNIINVVEPFMSESDIDKGAVGLDVIAEHLDASFFGIVCLTRSNMDRPWVNYEAGALSKSVAGDRGKVATLLIDVDSTSDISGPLGRFQATKLSDPDDFKQLVRAIANQASDTRSDDQIDNVVDAMWPVFQERLNHYKFRPGGEENVAPDRTQEAKIDEILEILREQGKVGMPTVSVGLAPEPGIAMQASASMAIGRSAGTETAVGRAIMTRLIQLLPTIGLRTDSLSINTVSDSAVEVSFRDSLTLIQFGQIVSAIDPLLGPRKLELANRPPWST